METSNVIEGLKTVLNQLLLSTKSKGRELHNALTKDDFDNEDAWRLLESPKGTHDFKFCIECAAKDILYDTIVSFLLFSAGKIINHAHS